MRARISLWCPHARQPSEARRVHGNGVPLRGARDRRDRGGRRAVADRPAAADRIAYLRRQVAPPARSGPLDGVLISHVHHDHLDRSSLRRVAGPDVALVLPAGAARVCYSRIRSAPFTRSPRRPRDFGGARVEAVPASTTGGGCGAGAAGPRVPRPRNVRVVFFGDTESATPTWRRSRAASTSRCCRSGAGDRRPAPAIWTRKVPRAPSRWCARVLRCRSTGAPFSRASRRRHRELPRRRASSSPPT